MSITKLISRASLILLFLTMTSVFVQAQDKAQVQSAKVAYITGKLDLSEEEAAKFWPVYNEYQKEKKEIKEKYDPEDPDAKVDEMDAEAKLIKEFNAKFKEILSADKVAKLHKAEEEFLKKLINELKGR